MKKPSTAATSPAWGQHGCQRGEGQQSRGDETARCLDKMKSCWIKNDNMSRRLVDRTTSHEVLNPGSMVSSAHLTSIAQICLSVREEEPSSTSRVVAQLLLGTVGTVGGTTRCSIILQRPSVVPFPNAAELNSQSITPVSSVLERGHAHQQKQPLCFSTEQRTGTWWWTWAEKPPSNLSFFDIVNGNKDHHHAWAYSGMGRVHRWRFWIEKGETQGPYLQRGLEDKLLACRGRAYIALLW